MSEEKFRYSKGEIDEVRIVDYFLPSPDDLVLVEDKRTVRALVDQYATGQARRSRK